MWSEIIGVITFERAGSFTDTDLELRVTYFSTHKSFLKHILASCLLHAFCQDFNDPVAIIRKEKNNLSSK